MPLRGALDDLRIKILFLAGSPDVTARTHLDHEVRRIEERLRAARYRDAFELVTRWAVRPDDLQQALLEVEPHIVHFSGQGTQAEEIVFESDDGPPKPVSKAALAGLFGVLKDNVRVVVLNACHSRAQAEAITEHIDCAIGMRKTIDDAAAIAFTAAFYQALAFGRTLQEAFDLGRNAVELERIASARMAAELVVRSGIDAGQITLLKPAEPRPPSSQRDALPSRREPIYPDEATRALSKQLDAAFTRRDALREVGADMTEVKREILDLRRQLRDGGRLRAGDALGDGRYRLLREVGHGGFGTVWEAHDRERPKRVAIKVLHPNIAGARVRLERFFRGARVMAELKHDAVVRVLERRCEDGGFYYFVMEFIDGDDLRRAVLSKRLTRERVVPVILRVGDALALAHEKGIIHRDVKPANILLDASENPRLTDFDLVAAPDTTGGTETGVLGSIVYSAPEMLERPQDADARADVYSLAMTAVFALRGLEVSLLASQDVKKLINELLCGEAIKDVLKKATDAIREARFEHAGVFCEELRRAARAAPRTPVPDQPLSSRPPRRLSQAQAHRGAPSVEEEPPLSSRRLGQALQARRGAPGVEDEPPLSSRRSGQVLQPLPRDPPLPASGPLWPPAPAKDPQAPVVGRERVDPLPSMIKLSGSSFWMGSAEDNPDAYGDEKPRQLVEVLPFSIGVHVVTQRLYRQVTGVNPGNPQGDKLPVNHVSFFDAIDFCNRLSETEGLNPCYHRAGDEVKWRQTADGYRLPTEVEWEYAARAGTETEYSFGDNTVKLKDFAWFYEDAFCIKPVGQKKANPYGLYDMHGNVWEWCWDEYAPYPGRPAKQRFPAHGGRVLRGGSYFERAGFLRSARRNADPPNIRAPIVGFRLVRGPLPRRLT